LEFWKDVTSAGERVSWMVDSKVSKMDAPRVDSSGNLMVWIWVASKVVMMVVMMVFLRDAKKAGL